MEFLNIPYEFLEMRMGLIVSAGCLAVTGLLLYLFT